MIELRVTFRKKVFANDEGFSIYGAEPIKEDKGKVELSKYGGFSVSGEFAIEESEMNDKIFRITMEEDVRAKYPNSYKMVRIHYDFPSDPKEQWKFLVDSNLATSRQYMNLLAEFSKDDKILDIILDDIKRVEKAKGFGEKSAARLQKKVRADKYKALIYQEFGKTQGIGPGLINKIANWRPDVEATIKAIKEDPFLLLQMKDIGFLTVDAIRESLGIPQEDKHRCLHGVHYYIVEKFQSTGNTYLDLNVELMWLCNKLGVHQTDLIPHIMEEMKKDDGGDYYSLKFFNQYATTKQLFLAENIIYKKTIALKKDKKKATNSERWNDVTQEKIKAKDHPLSDEQASFIKLANEERILILMGPGGSGKSWVTELVYHSLRKVGKKVGLYAPTARAAKIMTDYVGTQAATIARGLMKYANFEDNVGSIAEFDGFCPDDVIIIDEASMIDSELMSMVYQSMKPESRIIIIGDSFQLPSVGPGNVFYDLVNSLGVKTVEFTKVYRQSADSGIINAAQSLRDGTFKLDLYSTKVDLGEIVFFNDSSDMNMRDMGLSFYKQFHKEVNVDEIMFLSPTNKGAAGRRQLNRDIQEIVNGNPSAGEMSFGVGGTGDPQFFRKGDYITVTKNLYEVEDDYEEPGFLINGDLGTVIRANSELVTIEINDQEYSLEKGEVLTNIEHTWCTTIHKAQGGQADYVVIIIPENSGRVSANMLYTAITRAKKKCLIVGDFERLNQSSKIYANYSRRTMLAMQAKAHQQQRTSSDGE